MRPFLSAMALLAASPSLADQPRVVVDTPVTGSLVLQVMGDDAPVHVLLPQGASVHHHQMRPSDAQELQDADILIWTGPELTPWLERSSEMMHTNAARVRLLEVAGTHLRAYDADNAVDHQEADDHDHRHDHNHDHSHDHDHGAGDPHAWLDPDNARLWLQAIAQTLAEADPERRDTYAANAQAAEQRIAEMDQALQARLAPYADAPLVVFHDAYGYFTDHFGLKPAIAVSLGDASAPSAARLNAIRAQVADTGAVCAFPEYGSDPRVMEPVIEGTSIRMGAELSPEGRAETVSSGLYIALMTGMAETLTACLSNE